eukprot:3757836-Pleurochrysis_carterae.AAC.2
MGTSVIKIRATVMSQIGGLRSSEPTAKLVPSTLRPCDPLKLPNTSRHTKGAGPYEIASASTAVLQPLVYATKPHTQEPHQHILLRAC